MRSLKSLFVLMLTLSLVLTACGGKSSSGSSSGADGGKKIRAALLVSQLGDRSFNDSGWDGMKKAEKELGVQVKVQEAPEVSAYAESFEQFAKDGWDLVIIMGFTYRETLAKVAPKYPNTKFLIVDSTADPAPNVRSATFKEHEGSFLAGALAALKSKTGKVGFVGGQENPTILRFQGGYEQGAKHVNPNIEVQVAYVGAWNDAAKGKELTMVMFNRGADVVFAAAGGSGAGAIEAAKQAGKWSIGVDSNQDYLAPETMIGSMMKRVDNAVYQTIKDVKDGKFTAGDVVLGLQQDGVGISGNAPINSDISIKNAGKEALDKVAALRKEIMDGKIKVADKPQGK